MARKNVESRPDKKPTKQDLQEEVEILREILNERIIDEKIVKEAKDLKKNYELMYAITTEISNSPNMASLKRSVNKILRKLKKGMDYEEISVFLYDKEEEVLKLFASAFKKASSSLEKKVNEARQKAVFKPGSKDEGIVGHVFRTGEPRYTVMASKDPAYRGWKTNFGLYDDRSFLTIPLKTNGDVIGVITAMAESISRQTQEKSLTSLANVLAQKINQQRTLLELHRLSQEQQKTLLEHNQLSQQHLLLLAYQSDMRNKNFEGHSIRVTDYSIFLGKKLGLSREEIIQLKYGCPLHDIGKTDIRDKIIMKNGSLNKREKLLMAKHPERGHKMVKHLDIDDSSKDIVLHHHEWYKGEGYPDGLVGDEIQPLTQIVTLADSWDAMLSHRSYRKARTIQEATQEIEMNKGTQFSPFVIDAFLKNYDAFLALTKRLRRVDIVELEVQRFMAPKLLNNVYYLIRS